MRSVVRGLVAFALALMASGPSVARAYDEEVHAFLVRVALDKSELTTPAGELDISGALRVRKAIDARARASSDEKLRAEWTRRYPTPEAFDAWAEKELLLFSPTVDVFGIDRMPQGLATMLAVIETGSREPDDDWRNRDRLAFNAERSALKDKKGA